MERLLALTFLTLWLTYQSLLPVPPNAQESSKCAHTSFEVNEAVVNLGWLFVSVILDTNMSVKHVHTNQQIADILTKDSLRRAN